MDKIILKKRHRPQAEWDEDDECFRIPGGPSFTAELFHEAPQLISCESIPMLGEQWDLPVEVVYAMFEELPSDEMN